MIKDHRLGAAFGLCAFTRIIDDEWIEMRGRTKNGLREAILGQRQRLARQPFHIAMLSKVNDRIDAKHMTQPDIKGEIVVRRHQIGRVIAFKRIDVIATRGLQPDHHIAKRQDGKRKGILTRQIERIIHWVAPGLNYLIPDGRWQRIKRLLVVRARQGHANFAISKGFEIVGRPGLDRSNQGVAIFRQIIDTVSFALHRAKCFDHAGRGIKPDPVAKAGILVGIVRHDHRHLARSSIRFAQAYPVGGKLGSKGNTITDRDVFHQINLGQVILASRSLERHST